MFKEFYFDMVCVKYIFSKHELIQDTNSNYFL